VTFRAVISSGGDPLTGNAAGVVHGPGTNEYRIRFAGATAACVPAATLDVHTDAGTNAPSGEVLAAVAGDTAIVRTFSSAGTAVAARFSVVLAC
jgi:hypothetical protein